jgi:putative Holliday junction resolvase
LATETLLAFDFGYKRIGVAVGQSVTGMASPLTTLAGRDGQPDWGEVEHIITTWQPAALVVGLPCHLDGTEQDITTEARRFARRLQNRYGLPVHLVDERLTSDEAERLMRDHPRSNTADVDQIAAQIILQNWLDQREKHSS